MVSWRLLQRPQLKLSCTAAEGEEEDDSMSTSIADFVSILLTQFSITRQLMNNDNQEEEEEEEEEEEKVRTLDGYSMCIIAYAH